MKKKRILLVRFSAFGDLILTTGPLWQLKSKYPSYEIDLLTSEIGSEFFNASIEIDNTYTLPKGSGLRDMIKLYRKLPKYDTVIDWQDNFKSFFLKFFLKAEFYKIEKHSKARRKFVKNKKENKDLKLHVSQKYYKTLEKAFELPERYLEDLRPVYPPQRMIYDSKIFDFSKAVAIHMYASHKNKEWPHFQNLLEKLKSDKIPVVLVGNIDETPNYEESELVLNLINKTTIRELANVLNHCKAFVTTDSGPMHLGVAVRVPTIALFGPTTKEFGFFPRFKQTWVFENNDLDCRPCHVHGGSECPLKHHDCMNTISVDKVFNKLKEILV